MDLTALGVFIGFLDGVTSNHVHIRLGLGSKSHTKPTYLVFIIGNDYYDIIVNIIIILLSVFTDEKN